jgi:hypothetical protein
MHRLAPALLFTGAALLATAWLAEPAIPTTLARSTVAPDELAALRPAMNDLDGQVDLMRARLASPPAYPAPSRDPFRFGRRVAPAAPTPRDVAPAPAPIASSVPSLPRLIAIMVDHRDGAVVRRAVLSNGEGVTVVAVGDAVGAFIVQQIADDGIDLEQKSTSATFHVSLR